MKTKPKEKKKGGAKKLILNALCYVAAIIIYSVGVSLLLDPNGLASGGSYGCAIILNKLFGLGTGLWSLAINVPLIIIGVVMFGFKFFASNIVAIVSSSFLLQYMPGICEKLTGSARLTSEPIIAAVVGGAMVGLAVGMLFRVGSSLGGSDIVVKILHKKIPHLKTGNFYLFVDGAVVFMGAFVFGFDSAVYAIIALCVQSYILNLVLYGSEGARMIYIITENEGAISKRITEELYTGVTYLKGIGAYTGNEKRIMMCALRKRLLPEAKKIVLEEDPAAFMIVTSANQVLGKGFKALDSQEL